MPLLRELCASKVARCTSRIPAALTSAYDSPRATVAFEPVAVDAAVKAVAVKITSDVFEPATGIAAVLFAFECSLDPVSPVDETDPAAA